MTATQIGLGEAACVESLELDTTERRRLMDLGFCPGARIVRTLDAPLGGTIAFLVRGTTIALRDDQTDKIKVAPCKS